MKCEDLLQYVSDYVDQELDEALIEPAVEHLSTCENCRVVLDSTQQMIFLYREQGRKEIPAARRVRLFNQLQEVFLKKDADEKSTGA